MDLKKISICVIGVGNWGMNHIKTLMELNINVGCVDLDSQKLNKIKSLFPEIENSCLIIDCHVFLSKSFPHKVFSMGGDFLQKNIHDTTMTYLKYPNEIQGHIYVSWLHPFKEHRLVIIGSKGSIHFDDASYDKTLSFYEKDSSFEGSLSSLKLKNKDSKNIKYEDTKPLKNELKYFIKILKGAQVKKANIDEGIDVIKILEMATNSLEIKTN